jgi:aspartate/methionine/tyrosine aminotransferase
MQKIVYMEWVKLRPRAKFEISGSGVTPVHIDELPEARAALDINDFNLYGYRPLVQKIAERYEVAPEQVVTTQGTSMANYLAYASVVQPGDEVLVESPAYEPLIDIPERLGARLTRFKRSFGDGFAIDPDVVKKQMTKRTRLIVLTNMHNPSGVLMSNEVLTKVAELAEKNRAYVLVDEVYLDFLFEQRPQSSVHLGPNVIVTSSLTKAYGFDGLRCGWILAAPKEAKAMWRLQDFFGVNGAIPAEKTSVVAFERLNHFVERTRKIIETNRPLVDRFMTEHADLLKWIPPVGGPVCFPKLRSGSATKFVDQLRAKYEVGLIPGHFFEMPKHFRLGFGGDHANLKKGLARMSQALHAG